MSGRARYGDLLGEAAWQVAGASLAVHRERFASRAAAQTAVTSWRDLLEALHRHGRALFGSDTCLRGLRASESVDPREAAALRLLDTLAPLGRIEPRWVVGFEDGVLGAHVPLVMAAGSVSRWGWSVASRAMDVSEK